MSADRGSDRAGSVDSVPGDGPFRWLALAATAAVFALILLGSAVRATGSTLGCGDWPLCQGQLIPPADGTAAVEFAHRLAGLAVGLLVFATALAAWRDRRRHPWTVVPTTAALALFLVQLLVGGLGVLLALPPAIAIVHLATGEGILAALVVATVAAFRAESWPARVARSGFADLCRLAASAVFLVLLTGSAIAGSGAQATCVGWPFCQSSAFSGEPYLSALVTFHRLALALGGGLVAAVVARALLLYRTRPIAWLVRGATALAALYALQVGLGAASTFAQVPELAGVLHLAAGTGLWATLVMVAVLAYGEPDLALARAIGTSAASSAPSADRSPLLTQRAEMRSPAPLSIGGLAPVPVATSAAYRAAAAEPEEDLLDWVRRDAKVYLELTKPRIIVLLLITTVAGMLLASPPWPSPGVVLATLVGGALSAGGANALNQFLERDLDEQMRRTRRRPLPSHRATVDEALVFGVALGAFSFLLLASFVNLLAATLSLIGFLFYVFVYTMLLKRTTPQNIVVGGAAGAIPPMVGWAAVQGDLTLAAYVLFAIIFFWTPPHFWSLSIMAKRDYAAAGIPMLPVVAGDDEARRQILIYAVVLVAISLGLFVVGASGLLYLAAALGLGLGFVWMAYRQLREATEAAARRTFLFSNAYLALLFLAMVLDHMLVVL